MQLVISFLLSWFIQSASSETIHHANGFAACSRASDSTILANFCVNSNGANWNTKWNIFRPMNEWTGVLLNAEGCVQSVVLVNNNVSGVLPPTLGNLSSLRVFYIFGNDLYGEIPSELGNLTQLEDLVLEDNALTGSIPSAIANCTALKNISLANNQLSGQIPSSLGNLMNLTSINLSKNQLSGTLPETMSNLNKLRVLDFSANQLSGSVPQSFSQLLELREFYLQENNFTGTLPQSFSNFDQMNHFWVYSNQFTGRVPDLTDAPLFSLRIENNHFNSIPDYKLVTTWGNSFPFGLVITNNDLTFEDLIPLKNFSRRYYYEYDPQNPVRLDSMLFIEKGSTYVVQTLVDQGLTENNYKWYKDTSVVFISNQNTYEIIQASETDEGYYSGRITNPEINDFEIEIAPFRVIVFQPSKCDIPLAGAKCKDALHFCSTSGLHNYCGSLGVLDTSLHYFLCDTQVSVSNPRWLSFVAPIDSIDLEVIPINCSGVEENGIEYRGMQWALWQSCGNRPDSILLCKSDCSEGPMIISYNQFLVGHTYQLVLNGCHGDNCSYLVRVRKGKQTFELMEPGSIQGPALLCPGFGTQSYSISEIPGANAYLWYIQDTLVQASPDPIITFNDLQPGSYQLKVRAVNACDTTAYSFRIFNVNPILTIRNVQLEKLSRDSAFRISFLVEGGIKPYRISKGRGRLDSISGNFISDVLLCKSAYEFELTDSNGCKIVYKGFENCGCNTQAGILSNDTLQICEGQSFSVKILGNEILDSLDVGTYAIITDLMNPAGSILKSNVNGIFPFDPARFKFNTWYYVVRMVGRRDGKGEVNLKHPCLSLSNLQPLIFRPKPLISAGPDQEVCGFTAQLNGFGNFTSGIWKIVAGPGVGAFVQESDPQTSITVSSFGLYTLSFEVSNGFCTNKDEMKILFREGLMPNPKGFYFVCSGQSTELDAGTYEKYYWSTGDTTQKVSLSSAGNYCLTVSDANGCTGTFCFEIQEGTKPNAELLSPDTICTGRFDTIRVTENYIDYQWSDQSSLPYLAIDTAGSYCVSVTATNGCKDTVCTSVFSKPRAFSFLEDTVCYNEPFVFRNRTFATPGKYRYLVEGALNNGCDSVYQIAWQWWPQIVLVDSVILKDNGSGTGAILVTVGGGKGSYRYLWSNGARTPGITNLRAGSYTLFVTDAADCLQVFVFNVPMSTSTNPNGNPTEVNIPFFCFPNPFSREDGFYIRNLSDSKIIHLEIYHTSGHCAYKQTFVSTGRGDIIRLIPPLDPGFYIIHLGGAEKLKYKSIIIIN